MKGTRSKYTCQSCGYSSPKWLGRCPDCGGWNTFVEEMAAPTRPTSGTRPEARAPVISITAVPADAEPRMATGIGEFDRVLGGGILPGSLVLIGGEPGAGKCVSGDTRVLDPISGALLPVTRWLNESRPVLSLDDAHQLAISKVLEFHDQGVREIVRVKTRLGRILECTAKHPLLTPEGWRPVDGLTMGSRIASPRALPYFGKDTMDECEVKAIAYFLSDGSATRQLTVTNALPEVEEDLQGIARYFGLTLRIYPKANTKAKQFRFVQRLDDRERLRLEVSERLKRTHASRGLTWQDWARLARVSYGMLNMWRRGRSMPTRRELGALAKAAGVARPALFPHPEDWGRQVTSMARFAESHGIRFVRASEKHVPDCIFRLPRQQLTLFLKVIFSCDGSLYVCKDGRIGVSYSTISLRLARDLQHLLLRFGLVAKLRTKTVKPGYRAYELVLSGRDAARRFLAEIGIWGRDQAKKALAEAPPPRFASTHCDTIPTGSPFWTELKRLTAGSPFRELSRKSGIHLLNRRHQRPLRRSTVAALAATYSSSHLLHRLANSEIYWDEIESITPAGFDRVFDLTICQHPNFVANDLCVHNSTLLTQVSAHLAEGGQKVLYVTAEESPRQTRMRAERLGALPPALFLYPENDLEAILRAIDEHAPHHVVVDSIQVVYRPDIPSAPGSVAQVRECTATLLRMAKARDISVLLVGHVTKEGQLAGPRVLEHLVDTVLYFEGDRHQAYRILRATKNRFGSTDEIGVFEMGPQGLVEVPNPSAAFLAERPAEASGSAIVCAFEGSRSLLLEIQALVTPTHFGMPRRTAGGIDYNRLVLLLAVLERRAGLHLAMHDVYVSVAGGMRVEDPATDLGVAVAVASAFRDRPVDRRAVAIGEVGLGGEVRAVRQAAKRVAEAARLGFTRAVIPSGNVESGVWPPAIQVASVATISEALKLLAETG